MVTSPLCDRITNIGGTALAGNVEAVLQLSSQLKPIKLSVLSVKVLRKTGASATAHQVRISSAPGASANSITQFFRAVATPAASLYAVASIEQPFYTDALGRVYLNLDADAADTFEYEVWYQVLA
jgi:hypothetical protein